MSDVERVLWRIAELGARCSQQSAAGGREPLWAELEQTIAALEAELEAARQAVDTAPLVQVRTLEGRLTVARKERDRERTRAQEGFADAEAARRERDRERQKARKAMAAAVAAKATAEEYAARTAAAEATAEEYAARIAAAEATAEEYAARIAAAESAADQALSARDQAMVAFDEAVTTGDQAAAARDRALEALDDALARIAELETALETTRAEREAAVAAGAVASAQRDEAVDTLAARADGAVVVLPGVALPDAPEGPITPAGRVSWRPTWSEWAREDTQDATAVTANGPDDRADPTDTTVAEVVLAADVTDDADTAEMSVDEMSDTEMSDDEIVLDDWAEEAGTRRYLNVAATIGQLLPEDLGPLLLSGATVLRREGRLFATVAVTTDPWTPGGSDGTQQAQTFAEAGYRVEWTSTVPLAC
jgi:hypothetical protein